MASDYVVQIAHRDTGVVVRWAPGLEAEVEFIDNLCRRVQTKGVGLIRGEVHVLADVRTALQELLHDLKATI